MQIHQAYQYTSHFYMCQIQTKNVKWLIMSKYVENMCTNITKQKNRKSNVRITRNLKSYHSFSKPRIASVYYYNK